MASDGREHSARRDPIRIVPYDESWPVAFEHARTRLAGALEPWLAAPIDHIGSTAVPGLPAKPIIDMLALVSGYERAQDAIPALHAIGWAHAPEPGDADVRRLSFCFPDPAWRTHHLHVVEYGSGQWRSWLAFRDHLRTHPRDAREYARIKTELAARDERDRPAYRAGKAPFIQDVLRRMAPGHVPGEDASPEQ